ncbi:hypothetical protein KM043_002390 [Ampulex compressa]|nr:hypothetical protein KM043_002390 [Ampulex compressa]
MRAHSRRQGGTHVRARVKVLAHVDIVAWEGIYQATCTAVSPTGFLIRLNDGREAALRLRLNHSSFKALRGRSTYSIEDCIPRAVRFQFKLRAELAAKLLAQVYALLAFTRSWADPWRGGGLSRELIPGSK